MTEPTDYDDIAARYAAEIDSRSWNALYERPTTLSLLPPLAGLDVLDAGCGHGWYAERLLAEGARVVGVDRSAAMLAFARERVGDRARLIHGDIADLRGRLDEACFDLVLCSLVLHYHADLSAVFAEFARLLRPNGRVVLSTHHPVHDAVSILNPGYLVAELIEEEWGWLGQNMRYWRRPLRDITEPLCAAGFVIERLVEPDPSEDMKQQAPNGYDRLRRLPGFFFLRARKDCCDSAFR